MIEWIWLVAIVVLGLALFFFASRQRRLTRVEQERSAQAAHENWGKEEIH